MLPPVQLLLVVWLFAQTKSTDRLNSLPTFQAYKVARIYKGKPAIPVLRTPEHREYRTRIRRAVAEGANVTGIMR